MMKRILPLSLFLSHFFSIAFAQNPGTLDLSFNNTGQSFTALKQNSTDDYIKATYLQSDGKLLVTGYYSGSSNGEGFVKRLLPNGKTDPTFGKSGTVRTIDLGQQGFVANAITVQSNGNIVLAGAYYYDGALSAHPTIVSLKANGSINTDFNGNGFLMLTDFNSGFFNTVNIHSSTGNIIACGQTSSVLDDGTSYMLVAGMDSFGNSFFDSGYYITTNIGGFSSNITSAVQFHKDSLYLGVNQYDGDYDIMGVSAMSMVNGNLNDYFGETDNVLLFNSSVFDGTYCTSIALTAGKDIILGGYAYDGSASQFVARKVLAAKEAKDPSFGTTGEKLIAFGTSSNQKAYAVAVDKNDKIVLGGYYSDEITGKNYWAATRLSSTNGQADGSFSTQQFAHMDDRGIVSIQALTDEYILGGSSTDAILLTSDAVVKKINNVATDVTTYGKSSEATLWAKDYSSVGQDLAVRSDGKIWTCGMLPNPIATQVQSGIGLLNADGTADDTFGDGGSYVIPTTLNSQDLSGLRLTGIKIQGDKLLVAGTYLTSGGVYLPVLMRFAVSGNTLVLDNGFGINGMAIFNNGTNNYVQGLVVQDNTNVLVYGYFNANSFPGVICYSKDGSINTSFAGTGIYQFPSGTSADGENGKSMDLESLSDNSIIGVAPMYNTLSDTDDLMLFKLAADGSETFSKLEYVTGNDAAYSVAVKPDKSFFVGGTSANQYLIMAFDQSGNVDGNFGTAGKWTSSKGYYESIVGLQVDGDKLIALGFAFDEDKNAYYRSVFRFTLTGKLDNTFYDGSGYNLYGNGWAYNSVIANNHLYAIGADQKLNSSSYALVQVDKLNLGSGPVIKPTYLTLPNYINKFYGDKPFTVKAVTNSPAPVHYSVSGSTCATIDSLSGLVKLTCAALNPGVTIQATQAAVPGYTAATTYTSLNIARGIPTIVFDEQGAVVGEKFKLAFQTNYDPAVSYYTQLDPYYSPYFNKYTTDSIEVLGEGTATVTIYFAGSSNFEDASATAVIHGYTEYIAPIASDDAALLIYGTDDRVVINVLANDQAFSGQIVAKDIDLNPSTPDVIDTVYVSPSLGLFYTDTLGTVYYVPFVGFIGSGSISYTIRDNHGQVSEPATISISEKIIGEKPALKADELFTPNNDGLNDAFVIGHTDLDKTNVLKIYDRNGGELFTLNNYRNDWGGDMPNGNKAENGIYYYFFKEGGDSDQRELKGVVELRR